MQTHVAKNVLFRTLSVAQNAEQREEAREKRESWWIVVLLLAAWCGTGVIYADIRRAPKWREGGWPQCSGGGGEVCKCG